MISGCHKLHRCHLLSQRLPLRDALNQGFGLGFSKNILGDAVEISASSDLPNHGLTPKIVGCLLIADRGFSGWISVRFFPQSLAEKLTQSPPDSCSSICEVRAVFRAIPLGFLLASCRDSELKKVSHGRRHSKIYSTSRQQTLGLSIPRRRVGRLTCSPLSSFDTTRISPQVFYL
jgi:hypothetical protein